MSLTIGIPEKKVQKCLSVVLNTVKFERRSNYFVTCKLESSIPTPTDVIGRSLRTEVQSDTKKPAFKTKSFSFRLPVLGSPSKVPLDPFNSSLKNELNVSNTTTQIQPPSPHNTSLKGALDDAGPSLVLQAFEVVQDDKGTTKAQIVDRTWTGGTAKLLGVAVLPLNKYMVSLIQGEKIQAEIQFEESRDEPFPYSVTPNGSSNNIETDMNDTSEPKTPERSGALVRRVGSVSLDLNLSDLTAQTSPGPSASTPKRDSPFSTPLSKGPKPLTAEIDSLFSDRKNKLEFVNLFQDVQQVGESDKYVFNICVHAGFNLPLVQSGNQDSLPSPFVSAKTTTDAKEKRPAKAATVAIPNNRNVVWHERLVVEVEKKEAATNGLFISVIDANTKKYLGKCIIPVESLVFGEQYNMSLVLNEADGSVVLLSLMLDYTYNTELMLFSNNSNLHRLQVLFKGFQSPLPIPIMVMAILHIVPDGDEYQSKIRENIESGKLPQLAFASILLEDPDAFHAMIPSTFRATSITDIKDLPTWNEAFHFNLLLNDLTPKTSLVIEYYRCERIDNESTSKSDPHMVFSGYSITSLYALGNPQENGTPDFSNTLLEIADLPIELVHELKEQLDPNIPPLTVSLDLLIRSAADILKGDDQSSEAASEVNKESVESEAEESDEEAESSEEEEFPADYEKEESPSQEISTENTKLNAMENQEENIPEAITEIPSVPDSPIAEEVYEPETPKTPPIEEDPSAEIEPPVEAEPNNVLSEKALEPIQDEEAFVLQEESRKRREEFERKRRESEEHLKKRLQGQPSDDGLIVARPTSPTIRARKAEEPEMELEASSEYQTVPIGWEEQILKKQELIDRLLIDLDRQTDALKKVSDDRNDLRTKNAALLEENAMLRRKLSNTEIQHKEGGQEPTDSSTPANSDNDRKQILLLQNKLTKKTLKKNEIQKLYMEAQKTHTEHSIIIQELQDENAKLKKYKKTCFRQEEVIDKFEKLLAELYSETQRERAAFSQEIIGLKDDLSSALAKLAAYKTAQRENEFSTPSKGHALFDHEQAIRGSDTIPSIDMDNVKRQPVRHGSTGSYRRPSPKLHPLDNSFPVYHNE